MKKKFDLSKLELDETGRVVLQSRELELLETEQISQMTGGTQLEQFGILLDIFCGATNPGSCNNLLACEQDKNGGNCTNRQNCDDSKNEQACTNKSGCGGDITNGGGCSPP